MIYQYYIDQITLRYTKFNKGDEFFNVTPKKLGCWNSLQLGVL
jgi:hypothetical protein